jgi:hypothetical protein
MLPETDSVPRSAADQNAGAWLDRVEASVERAHAMLLTPWRSGLSQFTEEMEWAWHQRSCLAVNRALAPRLEALRARLNLVRSMLRQATAFEQAREQFKTEIVLGYTPTGLERALR